MLPTALSLLSLLLAPAANAGSDRPNAERPLLVMPVAGPTSAAAAFEAELARALRARLGERAVVTVAEIDVAISAERTKDVLGCNDVACFTELLGALGGEWVVGVTLVEAQPLAEVTAIARDVRDPLRAFRVERRTPSLVPARLGPLAADLAESLCSVTGWQAATEAAPVAPTSAAGGGSLHVNTAPSGARLFLNSEDIGRAPAHLSGLAAGRYTVRATDVGLQTRTEVIELAPGAAHELSLPLPPLRNWETGLNLMIDKRHLTIAGDSRPGSLLGIGVGARYQRAVVGPLEVGGYAGYNHLEYSAGNATDNNYFVFGKRDGAAMGVTASVAAHLGFAGLVEVAAASALPSERAQADEAIAWLEDRSTDYGILSVRLRSTLAYATPEFISASVGVEIGMMSILHFEVGYAALLHHPGSFSAAGRRVADISTHGLNVHVLLGYSSFYRAPTLE